MSTTSLHTKLNTRVLVIDDTESIHEDFRKTLSSPGRDDALAAEAAALFGDDGGSGDSSSAANSFVVDSAMQGADGFEKVKRALAEGNPYAIAFVDMRMPPGWDGLQTIEHLWKVDPELQVVICSAYSDYSWQQIIDRLGVNDRLLLLKKPFDTSEVNQLAVALTQKWLATHQAAMKLEELQELVDQQTDQLRYAAYHDRLTGLPNRSGLSEWLQDLIGGGPEGDVRFGLFFLDFDRFKLINDSLGHEAGDELLVQISQRLRTSLGITDVGATPDRPLAARLGGDEFVVVVPGTNDVAVLGKQADALLRTLRPTYNLRGHQVHSTASIGITTGDIRYTDAHDMVRDADSAMYCAKKSGKDRYVFFDRSMHDHMVRRLRMEEDLRRAQEQGQLVLHYQPIVDVESGRPAGFEALLRWEHPERGTVSPDEFIPIAEETGLILDIGKWVLHAATGELSRLRGALPDLDLFMSINLSKRQMLDPQVVDVVREAVEGSGVPVESVKIEITETAIMEKPQVISPRLQAMRRLGVGISMDDFGKGHSSLTCLHQFPLTVLKIDRAFVQNMEDNRDYSAIVQAIIVLAKNLDIHVVAEGIESVGQLTQIQALDCDYAQGYLFSRPIPADALIEYLSTNGSQG